MQHEHPAGVKLRLVPQGLQENLEWLVKGCAAEIRQTRLPLRLVTQRNGIQGSVGLGHKRGVRPWLPGIPCAPPRWR